MNNLILHKIVTYLKIPRIAKLFFYINDYRLLINSSNSHFDELYDTYGNKDWSKITNNIRSVQAMLRLKIPRLYNTDPIDHAIKNGHLEIVKWLHENHGETCSIYAMHFAALGGHLEVIDWLHKVYDYRAACWGIIDECTYDEKVVQYMLQIGVYRNKLQRIWYE